MGATKPEEYGLYFAWGETVGYTSDTSDGRSFDTANYKWAYYENDWSWAVMTKYCTDSTSGYNGFTDNKTELDLEDDAAYVNWGSNWRMPSREQLDELWSQCTYTWTQLNGVNVCKVTGPNGKSIFLSAPGSRSGTSFYMDVYDFFYWSRTLDASKPYYPYHLSFDLGVNSYHLNRLDFAVNVRPVRR